MLSLDRFELPGEEMVPVLRVMTPAKRLETAFYLARLARKMMLAQTATAHPDWTEAQIQQEVARRILRGAE
jgi:hypothetical protein